MDLPRTTYAVILVGALAWCVTIVAPTFLGNSSFAWLSEFIYRFFNPICHQLPERSFHLMGEKLAVCSRCSSIYFAFLIGVIVYPFAVSSLRFSTAPSRRVLLAALLPMIIDVGLDFLGIHDSSILTRTLTGVLFGITIPFFVVPSAIEGVQQIVAERHITIPQPSTNIRKESSHA